MQLFLKILSGIVNSVDPDQTAPASSGAVSSRSALFAYAILSVTLVYEILRHLLYPKYFSVQNLGHFPYMTYVAGLTLIVNCVLQK